MSTFKEGTNPFLDIIAKIRTNTPPPSRDKYIVVKHNGQQKKYRINKYGELFEVKQ